MKSMLYLKLFGKLIKNTRCQLELLTSICSSIGIPQNALPFTSRILPGREEGDFQLQAPAKFNLTSRDKQWSQLSEQ